MTITQHPSPNQDGNRKRIAVWISSHNGTTRHCRECRKSYLTFWNRLNRKKCKECDRSISYGSKNSRCKSCLWKKLWKNKKIDTRKISTALKGKRNSPKTEFIRGQKPWNYGIGYNTTLVRKIRQLEMYRIWRVSVLNRDNYTCQECKQKGGRLNVDHHLLSFASLIIQRAIKSLDEAKICKELWDIHNGKTLCISCHKKTKTYGVNYRLHIIS